MKKNPITRTGLRVVRREFPLLAGLTVAFGALLTLILQTDTGMAAAGLALAGLATLLGCLARRFNHQENRLRSEAFYRQVLDLTPDAVVVTCTDHRIRQANHQAATLFGYDPEKLLGLYVHQLWRADDNKPHPGNRLARCRDGSTLPVEIHQKTLEIDGEPLTTHVIRDMSDYHQAQSRIERLGNLYAALSQTNQILAQTQDQDSLFHQVCHIAIEHGRLSFAWVGLLDADGGEVRPVAHAGPAQDYLDGLVLPLDTDRPEGRGTVSKAVYNGSHYVNNDFLNDPDVSPWHGKARQARVESKAAFVLRREERIIGVFVLHAAEAHYFDEPLIDLCLEMARDISLALDNLHREALRKEAEQQVRYLGQFDALTSLPNTTLLEDRLLQALANAQRNRHPVVVLVLDLDRFKTVNDSLGHPMGNRLLQAVARRLETCLRGSDTVSRRGGDEFVIVLPDIRDAQDAVHVAEKILETLAEPYTIDSYELNITTSIGISIYPEDGDDMRTLIKNADAAMYHAKENGRNHYQFFAQDMNAMAFDRLMMENHLRRAVDRQEFTLHYQPQVDTETSRIIGAEALIRWKHPDLGMVPPDKFIPVAEDNGLILPIGEWALHEACRQNRRWRDLGLTNVPVAVNMSAIQFRKQDIQDTVRRVLKDTGIEPRLLELELTERSVMKDAEEAIELLQALKAMGLQLSIDDFGTGYSSLSYLKRFPLHKLKIDRSFVKDIPTDMDDAAITQAIIGMAHNLRLKVIAEGTETGDQLAFLRSQQCDEIQGYYFSRPLPADDFAELLRRGGHLKPRTLH